MGEIANSWLSRKKWILAGIGLPILVAAWWAFRPERLWVNVKVNEPAPFSVNADAQPVYTGVLAGGHIRRVGALQSIKRPTASSNYG
jgi:hypothetical protein